MLQRDRGPVVEAISLAEDYRHQYLTSVIGVPARTVEVTTMDGEPAHEGLSPVQRILR